jgi:hypothetical protein
VALFRGCARKKQLCNNPEKSLTGSSQFVLPMIQYVARGPIAQWLEQPAHKCAHVFSHIMPTEVGGTEVKVPKAGSYLEGKPEGDSSMTLKV